MNFWKPTFLVILGTLLSCTEEDEPLNSLDVDVYYDYQFGNSNEYPADDEVLIFLFYDINFHDGYSYAGNGYLIKDGTGEKLNTQKEKILILVRYSLTI